ncbi:MAG: hypothetical protein M3388_12715 [Acidobacteriota bacterium]|nr:hypothetical protein [Acidobacteriota bacterium]
MSVIQIDTRFVESSGASVIVALLESELDFESVSITRQGMAIKAIHPFDVLIIASTVFALNEFILKPLLGEAAEKWKNRIKKALSPYTPFNLTVNISEENFSIEARLGISREITGQVWEIISQSLDVVKSENLQSDISKIKFMANEQEQLVIFCYKNDESVSLIDLYDKKTKPINDEQLLLLAKSDDSDKLLENQ